MKVRAWDATLDAAGVDLVHASGNHILRIYFRTDFAIVSAIRSFTF